MVVSIYVLRLADSCFYVGRTKPENLEARIDAHQKSKGASWTSIHKVLAVEGVYHSNDLMTCSDDFEDLLEDMITKKLMLTHGIDKVRGGAYAMSTLPDFQVQALRHELRSCMQQCYNCGSNTHFIASCRHPSNQSK